MLKRGCTIRKGAVILQIVCFGYCIVEMDRGETLSLARTQGDIEKVKHRRYWESVKNLLEMSLVCYKGSDQQKAQDCWWIAETSIR